MKPAVFAIPGDITSRTGGFIYERRLLEHLRAQGREVRHLQLPASFPDPSPPDMADAVAALSSVPAEVPLIIDGLVFGALETEGLAKVRAPVFAMIHHPLALESGLSPARRAALARRETANLALATHVVVPSSHTASVLSSQFGVSPERISIAPPGFRAVAGRRRELQPPLILSVGILHPRKGHDTLLEALARIGALRWQAAIVGAPWDPEHATSLERQRDALGLATRVRFTGSVGEAELGELYGSATLFALATRYEGYGMVFSEALCHGLPIVACATGAVPDTVPAGTGLLAPPDNSTALASCLGALLSDGELRARMSLAATCAGRALPDWPDTAAIVGAALDRTEIAGNPHRAEGSRSPSDVR